MFTFANFSFEPSSGVVQFHTGDLGRPRVSLRVCISAGNPVFVIGTADDPVFYDAESIVRGLVMGEDAFDTALPPPLPKPLALHNLSADDERLILDAALGMPRSALAVRKGGAEKLDEFLLQVQTAGFGVGSASSIKPVEIKVREDVAREARELNINRKLLDAADSGVTLEINDPKSGFFVIDRAPDTLLRQLAARKAPNYEERTRMSWGFDQMQIGDRMTVPANLAKRGQTAVHVYASRVKKRFHTVTNRGTGNLTVIRLEDRVNTKQITE